MEQRLGKTKLSTPPNDQLDTKTTHRIRGLNMHPTCPAICFFPLKKNSTLDVRNLSDEIFT